MGELSGPVVVPEGIWIDGATAALLVDALRLVSKEIRQRDAVALNPRLVELGSAAEKVSKCWAARVAEEVAERRRNGGIPGDGRPVTLTTMSTKEAAERLGITPRAMRALAERRTVPGVKSRSGWTFSLADIVDAARDREARCG